MDVFFFFLLKFQHFVFSAKYKIIISFSGILLMALLTETISLAIIFFEMKKKKAQAIFLIFFFLTKLTGKNQIGFAYVFHFEKEWLNTIYFSPLCEDVNSISKREYFVTKNRVYCCLVVKNRVSYSHWHFCFSCQRSRKIPQTCLVGLFREETISQ